MDRADAIYEIPRRRGESAALYAAVAAKYPQARAPEALYMAGFAALGKGDYATALARHGVPGGYPHNALVADATYVAAESHLQLGQFAEAEKLFGELLQKYPAHADAETWKVRRGLALYLQKKYAETIDWLQPKLAKPHGAMPWSRRTISWGSPSLLLSFGRVGLRRRRFPAAAAEYQAGGRPLAAKPAGSPRPLWLGLGEAQPERLRGAESFSMRWSRSIRDHKLAPRARYARGIARHQQKNFAPAIEDIQALLAADPTPAEKSDARYLLGLCQAGLKKPAEAAASFQAILKDDPKYAGADKVLYELAWALKQQGKQKEAVEVFARLAAEHADSPLAAEAQYHVGESAYQAGDFRMRSPRIGRRCRRPATDRAGRKGRPQARLVVFPAGRLCPRPADVQCTATTWPEDRSRATPPSWRPSRC